MAEPVGDPLDQMLGAMRAAAEPTRLRILALCAEDELSVTDLTRILGQSQPRVSRHLKLLVESALLDRFREGTFAYFRLADRGPTAGLIQAILANVPTGSVAIARDRERLAEIKSQRAAQAADYFSRNAEQWDEIRALHIADEAVERALLEALPADGAGDLLDIGTGTGRMLSVMANRARRAVGIDYSREMLSVARTNLDREGLRHVQVRQGDIAMLPLADASFDVAVMHQVLHYVQSPPAAFRELARVLRPDGRLLIADFAQHGLEDLRADHAHVWLGFPDELVGDWLDRAGFATRSVTHLPGGPLTVTIWVADRQAAQDRRRDAA